MAIQVYCSLTYFGHRKPFEQRRRESPAEIGFKVCLDPLNQIWESSKELTPV